MLPIVLYTGTRTWEKLGQLSELVELGDEMADKIPAFQPLFLNVGQTSHEKLKQGGAFGVLLRLLQQRRARLSVFEQTLREVVQVLEGLADQERERWLELLSYIAALIYNEREVPEREGLMEKVADSVQNDMHRQEVYDMGKTIAEDLIEKGRQKGRQEGRQEGEVQNQRRMLLRLLRNKFGKLPGSLVKRIEATERLNVLDTWFDQASIAETLDDVSFAAE